MPNRIPMAFALAAIMCGCSSVRPGNGHLDPDEAEVLRDILSHYGTAVVLSEPSCELPNMPDIPLYDDDADLFDPTRLSVMGVFEPDAKTGDGKPKYRLPALETAEAYWRKKAGHHVTADVVIRNFPHDDGEAATCTLYLLAASRNVRALQFVRQCTLSVNPVIRACQ